MHMIAPCRLASPWWYEAFSLTYPASCATLISDVRLRLKHENMILR